MKSISVTLLFFTITICTSAQTFEGTIHWKLEFQMSGKTKQELEKSYEILQSSEMKKQLEMMQEQLQANPELKKQLENNPQFQALMNMLKNSSQNENSKNDYTSLFPSSIITKLKSDNVLTIMKGGMFPMETLYLKSTDETYIIQHDQKKYSKIPKEKPASANKTKPAYTIKKTNETENILNYTCKKFIVEYSSEGKSYTQHIWTTNDIQGLNNKSLSKIKFSSKQPVFSYDEIEGMPLKIQIYSEEGTMIMQVIEINTAALSSAEFKIPDGYKETPISSIYGY
ncbi:MAG: DUF4412 domain-containing protein [Cytophagaceae bacterium]|nr:DUF4412 domain-containing protein [Cytophagaceae bacterium]MDW8456520.1 DUF4412 domain-containing protein [Cytophagaceae bacterium]